MAPPPLSLFSPSPKPPPPWLHGPSTQTHNPSPTPAAPPAPDEAAPPNKPHHHGPRQAPPRNTGGKTAAKPFTAGVPGGRTRSAVLGIIRRVRSLELSDPPNPVPARSNDAAAASAVPFHLPIEPREQAHEAVEKGKPRAVPWAAARDEGLKAALRREKKAREPTRAESELAADELDRLRRVARGMGRWARAKKAGVTNEVEEDLRREWARGEELAAVRIVEPLRRNMDRAREILEMKTGGLVVWTRGGIHFIYRGSNYRQNTKHSHYLVTDVQSVSGKSKADDAFQEYDKRICSQKDEEPVEGTL